MAPTRRLVLHVRRRSCRGRAVVSAGFGDLLHAVDAPRVACAQSIWSLRRRPGSVEPAGDRAVRMSDGLRKVRRIYDQDPDAYHRAMSTRFSDWLTGGRRRKVGETVRGLVLDVGFGTGLSIPRYPHDARVLGIDVSSKMLAVGRRFARERSRQADVVVMDAERLALADHVFDSVEFNLCLCTIRSYESPDRRHRQAERGGGSFH